IPKADTSHWRGSCTDQQAEAIQIVAWFVLRWTVEVTFHEVRTHLGGRPSANGRIWPFCARLLLCWACFLSSPFLLSDCSMVKRFPSAKPPGTAKPCRPFPIRSRSFVSISGPPPVFRCRPAKATPFKFHEPFSIASWIRSLLLLDDSQAPEKLG